MTKGKKTLTVKMAMNFSSCQAAALSVDRPGKNTDIFNRVSYRSPFRQFSIGGEWLGRLRLPIEVRHLFGRIFAQ
jgi:hypothetical protein